jgi:hypothetical protein
MVETGYGGPKIAIFGSHGVLLYESTGPKLIGEKSLKHIIDSLRVVQRETNEYLTSLVNEQFSEHTDKNAVVMDKGKHELQRFPTYQLTTSLNNTSK